VFLDIGFSSCTVPTYCPCPSNLGESQGSGFNAKGCSTEERELCKVTPRGFGFGVWLLAEHPKGSNGSCIGVDNKLSRSCTLVNLQDV